MNYENLTVEELTSLLNERDEQIKTLEEDLEDMKDENEQLRKELEDTKEEVYCIEADDELIRSEINEILRAAKAWDEGLKGYRTFETKKDLIYEIEKVLIS